MQTVQIDAPFEVRKMEIREVIPPVSGAPFLILRDKRGRWIIDPYLVGIDHAIALKQAHRTGKPIYDMDSHMFADLDWLLSEGMKPYRTGIQTRKGVITIPFDQIAKMIIEMAERGPVHL